MAQSPKIPETTTQSNYTQFTFYSLTRYGWNQNILMYRKNKINIDIT
jgi:hypothetical protein